MQAVADELTMQQALPMRYTPTDAAIAEFRELATAIDFTNPGGYESGRLAIQTATGMRTEIESRRKDLKAVALEYGRTVDAEAKRLTGLVSAIEQPLRDAKKVIDDERERIKRERVELARAKLIAEEKAKLEAQQAIERQQREAESERMRIENERLEAERAKLAAEKDAAAERERIEYERLWADNEKILAAQKAIETERAAIAAERQRLERIEFERNAKAQAERDAAERLEQQRLADERRKQLEVEAAEIARVNAELLKPDVDKVRAFGASIRAMTSKVPMVVTVDAESFLNDIGGELESLAIRCEEFGKQSSPVNLDDF